MSWKRFFGRGGREVDSGGIPFVDSHPQGVLRYLNFHRWLRRDQDLANRVIPRNFDLPPRNVSSVGEFFARRQRRGS